MWFTAKGDAMIPFTTTYSSLVTMVYSPWPVTTPTAETLSSPDTVITQPPTFTFLAYTRGSVTGP
jgi:hypothetical protein